MDSGPHDRCLAIGRDARDAATSPAKENLQEHSPKWRKTEKFTHVKRRGAVSICVTAPIILPGPTNPWALHLPAPLPRDTTQVFAWTRVASCHVSAPPAPPARRVGLASSATWPCVPRRIRAGLACHVSLARHIIVLATSAPRGLWNKNPHFCDFNNRKIIKNQITIRKSQKLQKFIT